MKGIPRRMNKKDKILVERIKKGDKQAMAEIYDTYYKPMFNTAYRIVNDFHFAEDVLHEAFIKAFTHIHQYKGTASFGAWLKRIIINESLQWIKKYGHWHPEENDARLNKLHGKEEIYEENEPDFPQNEKPREILMAMRRLKDNYRTILSLYYIEGYDYDEITQIMGISYQNARTMLSRAKTALKNLLKENNAYEG